MKKNIVMLVMLSAINGLAFGKGLSDTEELFQFLRKKDFNGALQVLRRPQLDIDFQAQEDGKTLLEAGIDANAVDFVYALVANGARLSYAQEQRLIKMNALPSDAYANFQALARAIKIGTAAEARKLMADTKRPINYNLVDDHDQNLIEIAIQYEPSLVKDLLGKNIRIQENMIQMAQDAGQSDIAAELIRTFYNQRKGRMSDSTRELIELIKKGDISKAILLIKTARDINAGAIDANEKSLLDVAIESGSPESFLQLLIDKGAMITPQTMTIAEKTGFAGAEEIVKFLKSAEAAQIKKRISGGLAADNAQKLISLIRTGFEADLKNAENLIKGASPIDYATSVENRTVLDWAVVVRAPLGFIELLLAKGAKPTDATKALARNTKDQVLINLLEIGYAPKENVENLLQAIKDHNYEKALRDLNTYGIENYDKEITDRNGRTVISLLAAAPESGQKNILLIELADKLIGAGWDINKPSPSTGMTPLMYAIVNGNLDLVYLLTQQKRGVSTSNLLARNSDGDTPLILAIRELEKPGMQEGKRLKVLDYILSKSSDSINQPNKNGETPLEVGVNTNEDVVRKLLAAGATITARIKEAALRSPLAGRDAIIRMLEQPRGIAGYLASLSFRINSLKDALVRR